MVRETWLADGVRRVVIRIFLGGTTKALAFAAVLPMSRAALHAG